VSKISKEDCERFLLSLANEKGKFAIALGYSGWDQNMIDAFERGIDNDWFTLVDISTVGVFKGTQHEKTLLRIFKLTQAGWDRLRVLNEGVH
jgi:putative AlgH/UPF0301 family transcriptional regulator